MTNIKDVAERAGVSVATVSRALANKPHVRAELRQLVLRTAEEMSYRPSRIAKNMRHQSSRIIGMLISDIRNPFFTAIARAIEDVANSRETSIFLCNTDEDPEKEQIYLKNLLEERVAGIIISPTKEALKPYDALFKSAIPVVTIDRRIAGARVDSVLCDNVHSAQTLAAHLIENGYRRIGAVIGLKDSTTGRERMQGIKLAFAEHGILFNPAFATYVHPLEQEGEKVLTQWLAAPNRPDAILTGNSRLTIGALNAIAQAGLAIPRDVALAGFDETAWMPHVGPGVTVISQPTYEMGLTAADLLFQRIAEPDRPAREIILKGQLLPRGSTLPRRG